MSDTAAWLPAAGAIALLMVAYWLRSWARREIIYRPLRERRGRAEAQRRGGATSDPGATTAGHELADRTADPSTVERIATLAAADRGSPRA